MSVLALEPHISLAFSLQSQPGAYAVLLGAGASISSGIMGAWDIQRDLISRIAKAQGADLPAGDDGPFDWYRQQYGREPDYSDLLAELAPSQNARKALLESYFVPDAAERAQGVKLPTAAHRAVAQLVASGHVRIVLTLNFDHLMEQALRDEGLTPTTVADPAGLTGMLPLHAQQALVWHLHGEYTNPSSMLNTTEELEAYPEAVESMLDQLLDEYGLVIAGWSAKWDPALRAALTRCKSRRFASYWCEPFSVSAEAQVVLEQRGASLVGQTADDFLAKTAAAVSVLEVSGQRHPLSVAAEVAAAKRALVSEGPAIDLHDSLRREAAKVSALPVRTAGPWDSANVEATRVQRLDRLEADCEKLAALVATVAYWGDESHDRWWLGDIEHLAERPAAHGVLSLRNLTATPAVITLYAGGVAAVAAQRWSLLGQLLGSPQAKDDSGRLVAAAALLSPSAILGGRDASARLYRYFESIFTQHLVLGSSAFAQAWERFEYLRQVSELMSDGVTAPGRPHMRATGQRDAYRPVPSEWLSKSLSSHDALVDALRTEAALDPELLLEAHRTYDQKFSDWATQARWNTLGAVAAHSPLWYPDEI